ncbi:MAG TPA: hypothetical protein VM052_06910, partial [Candidatus Limnocylindrales bacterium]|nr:hypothetical protein [Candidatus Limnocylindrales bacterium]
MGVALVVALGLFRDSRANLPAATSSPSGSAAVVASGSPSASPSASQAQPSSTTPSATSGSLAIAPDARHGLVTFENIRTEADATGLQQPSQFSNVNT